MKKKEQVISAFTQSLCKHCKKDKDVIAVIKAVQEYTTFMQKQQEFNHDIILDIREIKEFAYENHANEKMLDDLYLLADEFIAGMILAGKYKKESSLLFEIVNDPAFSN